MPIKFEGFFVCPPKAVQNVYMMKNIIKADPRIQFQILEFFKIPSLLHEIPKICFFAIPKSQSRITRTTTPIIKRTKPSEKFRYSETPVKAQ